MSLLVRGARRDITVYTKKLSAQRKKKERKAKSSFSSSFSGSSPVMPVPLSQLASTSGVISTLASSTPVCAATYAVAGLSVSAVPLTSSAAVVEQPQKRKRVTDPAERALMWENFRDWWASGRFMPSTGTSSAPQPLLDTPPVDPGSSSALTLPAAATLSSSSVVSSHHSQKCPRPCPVPAPSALLDPAHSSSDRTSVASSTIPDPARSSSVRTSVALPNIPNPACPSSV